MGLKRIMYIIFIMIPSISYSCEWQIIIQKRSNNSIQKVFPGSENNPVNFELTEDGKVFANCITYTKVYATDDPDTKNTADMKKDFNKWLKQEQENLVMVENAFVICNLANTSYFARTSGIKFDYGKKKPTEFIVGYLDLSAKYPVYDAGSNISVICVNNKSK